MLESLPADPKVPVVELDNVSVRFRSRTALQNVSLTITRGTVLGLLGPNGAGKTTMIDCITGLRRPGSGSVRVLGQDTRRPTRELRRSIGLVPQETSLYPELSVRTNLRFAADLYGVPNADARVMQLLEEIGLADRAGDAVHTLSGGMRRRVAVARALVHDPPIVVLDEPTLGVDAEIRHLLWMHIRSLGATRTVIVATNYLDEAEAVCDDVVVLRGGTIVAEGTVAELIARAGRCIEVDCPVRSARLVDEAAALMHVKRVEEIPTGLRVYVDSDSESDHIVAAMVAHGGVTGVRVRAADMAELFRVVGALGA